MEAGVEYDVTDEGERLLILTNAEGAVDFKIAEAPIPEAGDQRQSRYLARPSAP